MNLVQRLGKIGRMLFLFMWIPFPCIFSGMVMWLGNWGSDLARAYPHLFGESLYGYSTLGWAASALTFSLMCASVLLTFGSLPLAAILNRRLLNTGLPARARILNTRQTGMYINENPMVRFTLEVTPETGSPFEAEVDKLVPMISIPQYQPGAELSVRYDPNSLNVAISDELPS